MEDVNRRSAMARGLTTAVAAPLVALAKPAKAEMYGPNEGKEFHPGVRVFMLGKRESTMRRSASRDRPCFVDNLLERLRARTCSDIREEGALRRAIAGRGDDSWLLQA